MTIHKIFADNLRRECVRFRSISAVCEGIGINRQQFNKYLAGGTIPNVITLRRICSFFNVSEQSLFVGEQERASDSYETGRTKFLPKQITNSPFGFLLKASANFDFISEYLSEGCYFCYFPVPNMSGMLIRSLICLKNEGRFTSFVRLTSFSYANAKAKSVAKGRHIGTVFCNQNEIYFLGVNRFSPFQPSLMAIEKSSLNQKNYGTGIILTRTGHRLGSVPTFIVYANKSENIRTMINMLGLVHEADETVDSVVVNAMHRR